MHKMPFKSHRPSFVFIWSPHDVRGNTVSHAEIFSTACFTIGIKLIVYPTIQLITFIDNGLSVVPRVYVTRPEKTSLSTRKI